MGQGGGVEVSERVEGRMRNAALLQVVTRLSKYQMIDMSKGGMVVDVFSCIHVVYSLEVVMLLSNIKSKCQALARTLDSVIKRYHNYLRFAGLDDLSLLPLSATMLDGFEILTTSGVVLWSRSYAPVSSSLINGFIKDVFIDEKVLPDATVADDTSAAQNPSYKKEKYTLKWASVKDLGLIFVVRMPTAEFRATGQWLIAARLSINHSYIFLG